VLRHLSVQAVCLQDLGVCTDRASLKQRHLIPHTQSNFLTAVGHFYRTQFLSTRTALQTSLQFAGHLKTLLHYGTSFCSISGNMPIPVAARSETTRLLGLRVGIPPWARKSVSCACCVLLDRGLCVGLITRPEESYRGCRV